MGVDNLLKAPSLRSPYETKLFSALKRELSPWESYKGRKIIQNLKKRKFQFDRHDHFTTMIKAQEWEHQNQARIQNIKLNDIANTPENYDIILTTPLTSDPNTQRENKILDEVAQTILNRITNSNGKISLEP
jgi:hypothetical protein